MKKIILLAPVAMFSLLVSCNNSPKNYLSLWSKMTSTFHTSRSTDTAVCEITRKIENKKVVYEELKDITSESNRLRFETYKKTYQYNDHGDLKYMESITTDLLKNAGELKHTETHDYRYNSKGLIEWHKIVVKNTISMENAIIPDTTEIESEYDKYDRCTKEKTYYVDKEKKRMLIKDVTTEYPENNFDNFTKQEEIKYDEFEGAPYLKTITTNMLDDKGYILRQFVTNYSLVENESNARPIPNDSFTYVERDKYHCATSVKVYSTLERIEDNLVSELEATYWKNNPERIEMYIYDYPDEYGEARYHDEVAIKYDDYGRISERTTEQSIDFDGSITTSSQKDVLEYDQLIAE